MRSTCKDCRFWNPDSGQLVKPVGIGTCQRFPPIINSLYTESLHLDANGTERSDILPQEAGIGVFPVTYCDNWCGEFVASSPALKMLNELKNISAAMASFPEMAGAVQSILAVIAEAERNL